MMTGSFLPDVIAGLIISLVIIEAFIAKESIDIYKKVKTSLYPRTFSRLYTIFTSFTKNMPTRKKDSFFAYHNCSVTLNLTSISLE